MGYKGLVCIVFQSQPEEVGDHIGHVGNDPAMARVNQDKALAALGLYRYNIPGDGNCLFRAVARQMGFGQDGYHRILRRVTGRWMRQHTEQLMASGLLDGPEEVDETELEGAWPGQAAIIALANIFSINIAVIQGGDHGDIDIQHISPFETSADYESDQGSVILAYLYNGHYDVVVDQPNQPNPEYEAWLASKTCRTQAAAAGTVYQEDEAPSIFASIKASLKADDAKEEDKSKSRKSKLNAAGDDRSSIIAAARASLDADDDLDRSQWRKKPTRDILDAEEGVYDVIAAARASLAEEEEEDRESRRRRKSERKRIRKKALSTVMEEDETASEIESETEPSSLVSEASTVVASPGADSAASGDVAPLKELMDQDALPAKAEEEPMEQDDCMEQDSITPTKQHAAQDAYHSYKTHCSYDTMKAMDTTDTMEPYEPPSISASQAAPAHALISPPIPGKDDSQGRAVNESEVNQAGDEDRSRTVVTKMPHIILPEEYVSRSLTKQESQHISNINQLASGDAESVIKGQGKAITSQIKSAPMMTMKADAVAVNSVQTGVAKVITKDNTVPVQAGVSRIVSKGNTVPVQKVHPQPRQPENSVPSDAIKVVHKTTDSSEQSKAQLPEVKQERSVEIVAQKPDFKKQKSVEILVKHEESAPGKMKSDVKRQLFGTNIVIDAPRVRIIPVQFVGRKGPGVTSQGKEESTDSTAQTIDVQRQNDVEIKSKPELTRQLSTERRKRYEERVKALAQEKIRQDQREVEEAARQYVEAARERQAMQRARAASQVVEGEEYSPSLTSSMPQSVHKERVIPIDIHTSSKVRDVTTGARHAVNDKKVEIEHKIPIQAAYPMRGKTLGDTPQDKPKSRIIPIQVVKVGKTSPYEATHAFTKLSREQSEQIMAQSGQSRGSYSADLSDSLVNTGSLHEAPHFEKVKITVEDERKFPSRQAYGRSMSDSGLHHQLGGIPYTHKSTSAEQKYPQAKSPEKNRPHVIIPVQNYPPAKSAVHNYPQVKSPVKGYPKAGRFEPTYPQATSPQPNYPQARSPEPAYRQATSPSYPVDVKFQRSQPLNSHASGGSQQVRSIPINISIQKAVPREECDNTGAHGTRTEKSTSKQKGSIAIRVVHESSSSPSSSGHSSPIGIVTSPPSTGQCTPVSSAPSSGRGTPVDTQSVSSVEEYYQDPSGQLVRQRTIPINVTHEVYHQGASSPGRHSDGRIHIEEVDLHDRVRGHRQLRDEPWFIDLNAHMNIPQMLRPVRKQGWLMGDIDKWFDDGWMHH